ncbi:hypothetical protein EV44_g0920 [Erysiphe necator]|uniref:Reverse transcriptase Ty1/copia-type domain-containing protein n=1 Tax=Uncinula necator TaxID=52586 RepID=A0A0B1P6N4_UNCNE|nr:hypothetical protein EV44_g0920 [Erysiphe necator]
MAISMKNVPVEAHWSIGKVERYHSCIRRAYKIIVEELHGTGVNKDCMLQMAVKALNDTAGPNGPVPTLLVFGAYPKMTISDPPMPFVVQRANAIKKAMQEINKLRAKHYVNAALDHRNGPNTSSLHDLPINSDILVWQEGPTSVRPYYQLENDYQQAGDEQVNAETFTNDEVTAPRRNEQRTRNLPLRYRDTPNLVVFLKSDETICQTSFEKSRQKEIQGLLEKGVFDYVCLSDIPLGTRIFNSRFVDEVKNKGTDKAYEKSPLVAQAFNDKGKDFVLTQSPTIQRVSQHVILALSVTLQLNLYIRDISQAYVQSSTNLCRHFFIRPPPELAEEGTILKIIKHLYGIPEARNHWLNTYLRHHTDKLQMLQSTYDPCLLYSNCNDDLCILGIQTDDTLFGANETFCIKEQTQLAKAGFIAKGREMLTISTPIKFNGGKINLEEDNSITLTQAQHCENLSIIISKSIDTISPRSKIRKLLGPKEQYVAQRARGPYVASTCQPEASFDLSSSAQIIDPTETDIKQLIQRINWQIKNSYRGIKFVKLDEISLKVLVFVDSSFDNSKDLSSQIGFIVILADKENRANIIHWSSTKSKRKTRSVFAAELVGRTRLFIVYANIRFQKLVFVLNLIIYMFVVYLFYVLPTGVGALTSLVISRVIANPNNIRHYII